MCDREERTSVKLRLRAGADSCDIRIFTVRLRLAERVIARREAAPPVQVHDLGEPQAPAGDGIEVPFGEELLRDCLAEFPHVRLTVTGRCMEPALAHGEKVHLVSAARRRPRVGDVVLSRQKQGFLPVGRLSDHDQVVSSGHAGAFRSGSKAASISPMAKVSMKPTPRFASLSATCGSVIS